MARTSRYKNIFAEGYVSNWSKEVFTIEKSEKHCFKAIFTKNKSRRV